MSACDRSDQSRKSLAPRIEKQRLELQEAFQKAQSCRLDFSEAPCKEFHVSNLTVRVVPLLLWM